MFTTVKHVLFFKQQPVNVEELRRPAAGVGGERRILAV